MVPVGSGRRPLLEYIVKLLVHYNIEDITLLTGYRAEEIRNYFGDGSRFRARINYSLDKKEHKGSGLALSDAVARGLIKNFDTVLIYYGDVLSNINIGDLLARHKDSRAVATLVLARGYTLPVGVAEVERGKLTSFAEKPRLNMDVTTGSMVLSADAISQLRKFVRGKKRVDLMGDFVPELLRERKLIAVYRARGLWHDVGTLENYESLSTTYVDKHFRFLATTTS